ncbi:hypothetical protein PanWU01x14_254720 [Parasponia andersonii]|uniref:Uncharacterized protein n=1 Tax=Parasponia andersonii TaxID=3476 RepID=A0A2P5BB00_PARAD|nr:hypothetical protein PanWU01x14_254720 [Parasponia andersonii]
MEENHEEVEDVEISSSDSFIDDSEDDGPSTSGRDNDGLHPEASLLYMFLLEPLSEEDIEELLAEFLEVESKAAEAQETLEKESLAKVESEVREELAQTLHGDDLETAVADEMTTFIEEWEAVLDELETESAHLLEQLDGAGIELPSLYKWIETQAPNNCSTEAWRRRIHWAGSQATGDFAESKAHAEEFLQTHRPVRRRHGKLLEEGASGFLRKKLAGDGSEETVTENSEVDWSSLNKLFSEGVSEDCGSFGSKHWASVYLASTPQQAAEMGLKFPGVNEVEEIDDIDGSITDPFVAAAVANEKELILSEEQMKNYRKVKEEDDANIDQKLQNHLKRRRYRKRSKQGFSRNDSGLVDRLVENDMDKSPSLVDCSAAVLKEKTPEDRETLHNNERGTACQNLKTVVLEGCQTSVVDKGCSMSNGTFAVTFDSALSDSSEPRGSKRPIETDELDIENKRGRTVIMDGDGECQVKGSVFGTVEQSELKNTAGDALPSQNLNEKFHCTACNKIAVEVHPHPLLKVIVCADCRSIIEEKMKVKVRK